MFSLANDLVSRAARLFAGSNDEQGLWAVTTRGRIVGALVCSGGDWRLSWAGNADPRLANYTGAVDGDVEDLAQALSLRLGAPVRFDAVSG